ncbi:MAG: hypothetical protein IJ423_02900 [Clostridia bacterium]|nr:hypothetical protein [Clostridia bacterium]
MRDKGENMMKKYEIPEIKITYFATDDTMTATDPLMLVSVTNVFLGDLKNKQIGNINFEDLK